MATNLAQALRLMLVTDDALLRGRDLVAVVLAAEQGGITAIQLRLKQATATELARLGRLLLQAVRIPVIVNDRVDVAIAIGAHGVHLGPDDMPVAMARRITPPGFIIGASVGLESELGNGTDADYWGIGPWSGTSTKTDAGAPLGAPGFARIRARAGGRPCIAIGGIQPGDVASALAAGASGVAVVSGILGAEDVTTAASRYLPNPPLPVPSPS
jgi:thiamine-phosphate pyrophosphorylase